MVLNNFEMDVKVKCIEENTSQRAVALAMDTTPQYVNRIIKRTSTIVNPTFVEIMEALGYDIELTYVKREE